MLALLADGLIRGKSEAAVEAGVSVGVIEGLIDEGALETLVLPPEPVARAPDPNHLRPDLTPAQQIGTFITGAIQLALAAAAWTDLARRSADEVNGPKPVWAVVIAMNFIGPIVYYVFGRRWPVIERRR